MHAVVGCPGQAQEVARLETALARVGQYTPADAEAVAAAKRAADAATASKIAECDGIKGRGPLCKQWERDEAAAATKLAEVTAAKATTDMAKGYETQIAAVQAKLGQPIAEHVGAANPLGRVLENMIGSAADTLTAWQQAIVALVFELCLVGAMVGFAVLGEVSPAPAKTEPVEPEPAPEPAAEEKRAPARPKLVVNNDNELFKTLAQLLGGRPGRTHQC